MQPESPVVCLGAQTSHTIAYTPGDRYPIMTTTACNTTPQCMLAVAPYRFTYRAPVKGRWINYPLLTVFMREFAYIQTVDKVKNHNNDYNGDMSSASTDPRITIPAYIEELRTGALTLHGREAECIAAGHAYEAELGCCSDLPADKAKMELLLRKLPPRLLLQQKDIILHQVFRRETPIPCDDPLHILSFDHMPRGNPPRSLLFTRKPHGIPVHPSGRFRKNSVTSILEDIFGGADAHRYHAVPLQESMREEGVMKFSIRHKQYDFELIRVWVGDGFVRAESWEELRKMLEGRALKGLKVFVVHRLDTATSGVLLFALDATSARMTAELLRQKEEGCGNNAEESSAEQLGCIKHYLARVHGRFDIIRLAETEHDCSLLSLSSLQDASERETTLWLRIERPIGCLSYHNSLYWSPDAAVTQSWLKYLEEQQQQRTADAAAAAAATTTVHVAGKKRVAVCDAAVLEAKHERMRQLALCGSTTSTTTATAAKETSGAVGLHPSNTAEKQVNALRESMKWAVTLARCISHDAVCDESVVECRLLTGRTHQVRVHLASLGHPICGDTKYVRQAALTTTTTTTSAAICDTTTTTMISLQEAGAKSEEELKGEEAFSFTQSIFLHAWRYTIQYAVDEKPEVLEAPPPEWAKMIVENV